MVNFPDPEKINKEDSEDDGELLLFDLNDDKVYVGIVVDIGIPDEHKAPENITIMPIMSGYRDEKRNFVVTTNYLENKYSTTTFKEEQINVIKDFDMDTFNMYPKSTPTEETSAQEQFFMEAKNLIQFLIKKE